MTLNDTTELVDSPPSALSARDGKRVGIIGGGFLGMSLAERFAAAGHQVTLVEAASHLGGMADAWQLDGVTWDRHYHVILESDRTLNALLSTLGLGQKIRWGTTRTGFFTNGRHVSMSNSVEFLRFPPINLLDKIRLALTILYCSRIEDWQRLESEPVLDFLRRWSGERTTDKIWRPLLRAKLGDDLVDVSAAFIWASIRRMYAARRSGMKTERFGYVEGGYATILEAYGEHLGHLGIRQLTDSPVREVTSQRDRLRVETIAGKTLDFDSVVLTQAPSLAARLCPALSDNEREALEAIRYRGVVCLSLLLERGLEGFYVTNIIDDWVPFTGVIEMSALVPPSRLGDRHLVYLPKYVDPADPIFAESEESIRDRFFSALKKMYPGLEDSDLVTARVSKVRRVTAVPTLGYSRFVPPFETSIPGLFTVNSSQIVNGTLNVEETLQLADRAWAALRQVSVAR